MVSIDFGTTTLSVQELAKKYPNDYEDENDQSMLWAAKTVEDAKFLIETIKVPVDVKNIYNESVLSSIEDGDLVEYLVSKGVPQLDSYQGNFATDKIDNLMILSKKYTRDAQDINGQSMLWTAKTVEDAKFLIEEIGVNMFALDGDARTILFSVENVDIVHYLFSLKSDDEVTERHIRLYGHQPWFIGNDHNTVGIQGNSIRHIDYEAIDDDGNICCVLETNKHVPVLTEFIRRYKANKNLPGLLLAIIDNLDILKLFISLKVPIPNNILTEPKIPVNCFKELVKAGANVNARNMSDRTPLMIVRSLAKIDTLLKSGADTNAIDGIYRKTAMFHQSDKNRLYLLRRGVNPFITTFLTDPVSMQVMTSVEPILMRAGTTPDQAHEFYRAGQYLDTIPFYLIMALPLLIKNLHPKHRTTFSLPMGILKMILESLDINIHSSLYYKTFLEMMEAQAQEAQAQEAQRVLVEM